MSKSCQTSNFSVVICKNDRDEFLAVKETKNRGWWLPAGRVDEGETFEEAALRETMEEAGVKVKLKGLLRVERSVEGASARMRVVFYAEPDPPHQVPKSVADKESEKAEWVTLEKYEKIGKLRGNELLQWGEYIERGGTVYPLSALSTEWDPCDLNPHVFSLTRRLTASALVDASDEYDKHHEKVLHFKKAIGAGDVAAVTKMLEQGMEVNTRFHKRWTPLHTAIFSGKGDVFKLLLDKGADVMASTHKGRTVVHFAAASTPEWLKLVLQHGGTGGVLAVDQKGETPFHWAARSGKEMYDTLCAACTPQVVSIGNSFKNFMEKVPADLM